MLKRAALLLLTLLPASLGAQGLRTGTLTGVVSAQDGSPVAGVTVTVSSPVLQGKRDTTTDGNGGYIFKGLPAGDYTVKFTQGTLTIDERKTVVTMGETAQMDARVGTARMQETVDVAQPAEAGLEGAQGGVVYRADDIDTLPVGRGPVAAAELAPGVTNNTPNGGQVTVSGGFGYDNVFLVDGVDINDNVFGSPANLYIEEAVEETQVVTSAIPAEFGRFAGGVVNVVSKKGSNRWSGSLRTDFANTSWRSRNPFEKENNIKLDDRLSRLLQGTLGGPAIKDRLWFFAAGRGESSSYATVLERTGVPYNLKLSDQRVSLKLTGRLAENHTLESYYLQNWNESYGPSFLFSIDPKTLNTARFPSSIFVASYGGVLRDNLFAELQYSQKTQGFRDMGGTSQRIEDSPFLTATQSLAHYNAPYFDSEDPEDRNNRQLTGSVSYFLTTRRFGRHDLKAGFEHFNTKLVGGNSPSSTSIVFTADYKTDAAGRPVFDGSGRLIPVFVPGTSGLSFALADRGATLDIRTLSFFISDRVVLNSRWSLNLGLRYESVRSEATGGVLGVDTDTLVPRLALNFYPTDKISLHATYAEYAGKYNESQFGQNTSVGNPEYYDTVYVGPPGEGLNFAPAFDLDNYALVGGSFPTANVFFAPGLSSPVAREMSLVAGRRLGTTAFAEVVFTDRRLRRFVEDFITIDGGFTRIIREGIDFGEFDNQHYRNSDAPKRHYQAVQILLRNRFRPGWLTEGHYTLQLKNHGNFTGEATNRPALTSLHGNYPELLVPSRNFPEGRLFGYQKHKVRLWNRYRQQLGRLGHVELGALWRFDSGLTYSLVASTVPLSSQQRSRNPGYKNPPTHQSLFFGERGSQDFESVHLFDAALTWTVPVWRSFKPYVKLEAYNLFNNAKLVTWDTTLFADSTGPTDGDGLPTRYVEAPTFGKPTGVFNYPGAREFAFSVGLRF